MTTLNQAYATFVEKLESDGPDRVAYYLSQRRYNANLEPVALQWIEQKREAAREVERRGRDEEREVAKSSMRGTWVGAWGTWAALFVGVLGIVVALWLAGSFKGL